MNEPTTLLQAAGCAIGCAIFVIGLGVWAVCAFSGIIGDREADNQCCQDCNGTGMLNLGGGEYDFFTDCPTCCGTEESTIEQITDAKEGR